MFKERFKNFVNWLSGIFGKKLMLGIFITLLIAGGLIGIGLFLYWGIPKLLSFIWSGIRGTWTALWSLFWDPNFLSFLTPWGDENGTFVYCVKVGFLFFLAFVIVFWAIPTYWQPRKEKKSATVKAADVPDKKDAEKKEKPTKVLVLVSAGFKAWPVFKVNAFQGAAVNRLGSYVRAVKPGQCATLDKDGTITEWKERFLTFLGGFYFKWPGIETVDIVFMGTSQAEFVTTPINTMGKKLPPLGPASAASKDLAKLVEMDFGQDAFDKGASDGPQVTIPFMLWYEVNQIIHFLRLDELVRNDLVNNLIKPTMNDMLQDVLPDCYMADIQRCPSPFFLIGTRDELKGMKSDGNGQHRDRDVVKFWSDRLKEEPFSVLDFENLSSPASLEVIERLRNDDAPYYDRQRKNCVLMSLLEAGINLRLFRRQEVEPEPRIREKITEKGEAQADFEIGLIKERGNYATELIRQQTRIASAVGDAQKVEQICAICKLPDSFKPFLVAYFQQQRTKEFMAEKGKGTIFAVSDEMLMNIGSLIERLQKTMMPS